jgi:hypothetical protein
MEIVDGAQGLGFEQDFLSSEKPRPQRGSIL